MIEQMTRVSVAVCSIILLITSNIFAAQKKLCYPSIILKHLCLVFFMTFKKLIRIIHLWLGLASGVIIIILGITGCLLAFETEIRNLTESYKSVQKENVAYLPPSDIRVIANQNLTSKKVLGIEYPGPDKAVVASYYDETHYEIVYINPYNGRVLKHKDMTKDFFRVILDGHFYLWLPHNIGQPIMASATLIFLIMIISGIILWWPKNKAASKQRFSIKWNAKWRRKNYDLHNVLGFYMSWIGIFLAVTGLVMGFQWFAKSVYWVSSGGKTAIEHVDPKSDTTKVSSIANVTDYLWQQQLNTLKKNELI